MPFGEEHKMVGVLRILEGNSYKHVITKFCRQYDKNKPLPKLRFTDGLRNLRLERQSKPSENKVSSRKPKVRSPEKIVYGIIRPYYRDCHLLKAR